MEKLESEFLNYLIEKNRSYANILEGLDYLHSKCNLIHTDIKPENICIGIHLDMIKTMALEALRIQKSGQTIPVSHKCSLARKFGDKLEQLPEDMKLAMKINRLNSHIFLEQGGEKDALCNQENHKNKIKKSKRLNDESLSLDVYNEEIYNPLVIKIADMGNAIFMKDLNSHTIQTKPYRSPEVILGIGYNTSADIWSLACTIYEMATGRYLFKGRKSDKVSWEESHLASIIEKLGDIPTFISLNGRRSKKYFEQNGELKNLNDIIPVPICRTLVEKFEMSPTEAGDLTEFLIVMLKYDITERATAAECLQHPWLSSM
ncbi:unnamed protein product [Gordionus sp. m RMFG-2023]